MGRFKLASTIISEVGNYIIEMSPTEGLESKEGRANYVTSVI